MAYYKQAGVLDYSIKSDRLCIPFAIVHSATPALKTSSTDLPSAMILALQGQTAAAAAIDAGTNFATPTDSTGVFGVLLYGLGPVKKLLKYEIFAPSSGTVVLAPAGASSSGVTASGNIAIGVDSSLDLSAADLSGVLCVDFIAAQD